MALTCPVLLAVVGLTITVAVGQETNCKYNWYIPPAGRTYTIRSPNSPSNYRPGTRCYWSLYTDAGYNLNLNCYEVNLDRMGGWGCLDTISVEGSNSDNTYCSPFNVNSSNHKIAFSLQSSFRSRGGTFACRVQMVQKASPRNCECGRSLSTKVVGGSETGVNQYPFMAALIDAVKRAPVCGATIISQRYVVTAAHCIDTLTLASTGILVGAHDMRKGVPNVTQLYRSRRFIVHPQWDRRNLRNDIALVESEKTMVFSSRVNAVCLPINRPIIPEVGEQLIILGWGTTSFGGPVSDVLQEVGTRVVPIRRCQEAFNRTMPRSADQVCTFNKGKDSCQFDSGGPLLSVNMQSGHYYLAAIVSYGGQCADEFPAVSTKVSAETSWIQRETREDYCVL